MNKSPFNKILATVNGQKVLGEKVEFDLTYKEIKHIRRCLNFYNHIHPPYDEAGEEALDILKKFKRFGSMQRRSTKQKTAFRNKKDVPHVCSWEGCGKKKKLTIDHIMPVRSGGTGRLDNLQWLCKRHHDIKNITERIETKKKEIKVLKKEVEDLK